MPSFSEVTNISKYQNFKLPKKEFVKIRALEQVLNWVPNLGVCKITWDLENLGHMLIC